MSGQDHIDQELRTGAGTKAVTKAGAETGAGDIRRSRRSGQPHLRILPSGRQEIRAGKNLVLTCRAQVGRGEIRWDIQRTNAYYPLSMY